MYIIITVIIGHNCFKGLLGNLLKIIKDNLYKHIEQNSLSQIGNLNQIFLFLIILLKLEFNFFLLKFIFFCFL